MPYRQCKPKFNAINVISVVVLVVDVFVLSNIHYQDQFCTRTFAVSREALELLALTLKWMWIMCHCSGKLSADLHPTYLPFPIFPHPAPAHH